MKRFIYIALILLTGIFAACKEEGLDLYNDEQNKNSIYFPISQSANGIYVAFGYVKSDIKDSVVKVVIRAIGASTKSDRPYNLAIADSSTMKAGIDYEILNPTLAIAAGKVADTLKIRIKRNARMQSDSLLLYMDLKPNEHFTNNFLSHDTISGNNIVTKYYTRLKLKVDDIAGAPPFWQSNSIYYKSAVGQLGTFSSLKLQLLLTRYNLDINKVVEPKWYETDGNASKVRAYASGLKAYFTQMEAANTPVYEADGITLMKMGNQAQ